MKRTIAILLCIILLPLGSAQAKRVSRARLAALICIFGKVSVRDIAKLMESND